MKEYQYTDYGINHANSKAIVYRFANGEVREITAADFGGDENEFRKWKELSDNDLHVEFNHTKRISRRNVSIDGLDDTQLCSLPSVEDELVEKENDEELAMEMRDFFESLTEVQRRRFILYALYGKTQCEIAQIEGATQPRIHNSIVQIEQKLKKSLNDRDKNGSKMVVSERLRCYESYFKKATEDLENRKKKKFSGE